MRRILLVILLAAACRPASAAPAADFAIDATATPATRPASADGLDRRFATLPPVAFGRVRDCRLDGLPPARLIAPATLSAPAAARSGQGLVPALEQWLRLI
jgi:hypothetical protein